MTKLRGLSTTIAASAVALLAGVAALTLSLTMGAAPVSASSARNGQLHATKDCSTYTGVAGDHCTITASNLAEIPIGSPIFYDQAAGIPTGLLDSNIVLDAGNGNRAIGRCTLDFSAGLGLCTFSDGTGQLAGFTARVNVSCSGILCALDGTYRFKPLPPR
jgi:hypothetical protein